jgi:RHS repeat-associated protein
MTFTGKTSVLETPGSKAFHFNGHADGSVGQDVNQFQGSVSFSVPVVSLPGRSGLDLELTLAYCSNIAAQVGRSNVDAPTGILGLGWDLLVDCIEADYAAPGNRDSATYFVTRRGARNRLYRAEQPWKRAELPAAMATALDQGSLESELLVALLAQSLVLDSGARVSVDEPNRRWLINDPVNEFTLRIERQGSDAAPLAVFDGGNGYELESHDYSRVRYYTDYERWEVYAANGECSVFGGGKHWLSDGNLDSRGHSIVWGVRWGHWAGPSSLAVDALGGRLQAQFPQRWMISSQRAVNRDEITYAYAQVRQAVGAAGLLYSKAIYLELITDMFGRTVHLSYGDKQFGSEAGAPREYLDPYKPLPDTAPDAYQSHYETRYLQRVEVYTAAQQLLFITRFDYALNLYCPVPGNAPPTYAGDRYKRVLTSIRKRNGQGFGLPSMDFSYHDLEAVNPGALASKTLPEGAVVLYTYQQKTLSACTRSLTLTPAIATATPRLWFGTNYVVVMWLAADRFSVSAYTWSGRWIAWQPRQHNYAFSGDGERISASLQDSFFVLGIPAANRSGAVVVYFHKNNRVLGGWLEPAAWPWQLATAEFSLASGSRFFAIASHNDNSITRHVWNAATRKWMTSSAPLPATTRDPERYPTFLAASANLLCTLFYDRYGLPGQKQSVQRLDYIDEAGLWHSGSNRTASELAVAGATLADLRRNLQWTAAPWVCVATAVTQDGDSSLIYQISLYTWGKAGASPYQWDTPSQPFAEGCRMDKAPDGTRPFAPASRIGLGGMLSSGPNLLRFNGLEWLPNQNLALRQPAHNDSLVWFAPGPDIVLKTENSANAILGQAQVYDPNQGAGAWSAAPITLYDGPPVSPRLKSYFPSAGRDFISFDRKLYYRGSASNWVEALQHPIPGLPAGANSTTLINQAPGFMVYLQENQGVPTQTEILLLDSASLGATETLRHSFFRLIDPSGHVVADSDGQAPAGEGSFATFLPLNAPFAEAQSITLNRYLNGSITRPVTDYPVLSVTVDDGYQRKNYHYDFDAATAAVNPQGYSGKYYHSRVQVGDGSLCGHSEFTFINGVGGQLPGNAPQPAVFDGQLALKQDFTADAQQVSEQRNTWRAVHAASDPQSGQMLALHGACVQLAQARSTLDGVTSTQDFTYDPGSGQVLSTSTQVLNALGVLETHRKWVTLGYGEYPQLGYTHQLALQTGSGYAVSSANQPPVTSAQQWVSLRHFAGPVTGAQGALQLLLPWKSYARQEAGTGSPTAAPAQWLQQSEVLHCTPQGIPREITNAAGLLTSSLFSADHGMLLGTFAGASIERQEAYFLGFEPYESPGVWSLDLARTPIVDSISCTGTRSLCIPPATRGVPLLLTPEVRSEAFLFSYWGSLDPTATDPEAVAAWRIEFVSAAPERLPAPIILHVTHSEWAYGCARIDLSAFTAPVTLRFTPLNSGHCNLYLDNVCFCRLNGGARIKVYDPLNELLMAEVGPYNQIRRVVYDFEQREIATTSEFQAVTRIVAPYLSRQDAPAFAAASPNSQLVQQPMGATLYERFRNNGVFSRHFTTERPTDWRSFHGQLVYLGDAGGSVTLTHPAFTSDYTLRFDVATGGERLPSLGVSLGTDLQIRWEDDQRHWLLSDSLNGTTLTHDGIAPEGAWAVALSAQAVIFVVNGKVIFDYLPAQMPSGQPGIRPDGALAISNFIAGGRCQMAMQYFDGASRPRQGLSIEERQVVVSMSLYDAAARPLVKIKPVAYSAPPGSNGQLLGLRQDLVTEFDWRTGILSGKAAEAWPNDEGYPYVRQLLEASPLQRVLQSGVPGKDFAITGDAAAHTARQAYGSNQNPTINSALGLPAGRYNSITHTDPDGHLTVSLKDTLGRPVATATRLAGATPVWLYTLEFTSYSPLGLQHTTRLPNYYAPPPGSSPASWINVSQRDRLGLRTTTTTSDGGVSHTIADATGRTRFTQTPTAAALGRILYAKYDDYGRRLEDGWLSARWDEERLLALANQRDWPDHADNAQPVRQYQYGEDEAAVNTLGRLIVTLNHDEADGTPQNAMVRDYDAAGQLLTCTLTVLDEEDSNHSVGYSYDNLGNVASTVYPSGYTVHSERDAVGRVKCLRDGSGQVLARYTYNPDDQPHRQALLPETAAQLSVTYGYAPPGWLQHIESACMSESLGYASGGYAGQRSHSGRPDSASTLFANFAQPTGDFPAQVDYAYAYDARGQLSVAQARVAGQPVMDWSFGLGTPTEYDPNGNFLHVQDGASEQHYVYKAGTNQVQNTTGGNQEDYAYNAAGAVVRAAPAGIERIDYQLLSQRTQAIQTANHGLLTLTYDGIANRVRKTTPDQTLTYIRGVNGWPLAERLQRAAEPIQETEYIYGPRGICAIRRAGVIYTVLTDHLHSVRGLAGPDGKLLAAFHYNAFGQVSIQFGDARGLRYRFTGYEYDPETGLYNAAARLYDPQLKRFYSIDPKGQFASPYLYVGNNPIALFDPSGEAAWGAILGGSLLGLSLTLLSSLGLGLLITGLEGAAAIAASAVTASVSCALGSVAGDATTAGIAGERFTARNALIDLAASAAGGVAGAVVGGTAAQLAMKNALALNARISAQAVTNLGAATSFLGSTAGAIAQGGVLAALTGHNLASNLAIGGLAAFGGALLGSGTYLGWTGETLPVPIERSDFPAIQRNSMEFTVPGYRCLTLNIEDLLAWHCPSVHQLNATEAAMHDVVDVHGFPGMVFPSFIERSGGFHYRPMSTRLFAEFVASRPGWASPAGGPPNPVPIKLSSCYGAFGSPFSRSAGQSLATALGRTTVAPRSRTKVVSGAPTDQWVRFT